MRYLIDGYNLAHALRLIHGKVAPAAIEVARRSLLVRLLEAPGLETGKVTVVFDAQRSPPTTPAQQSFQGIRILNALRQQADDVIEDLIANERQPRQLAVVSDDHRIKDAARRRKCVPLGCLDFLEAIQKPPAPTPPGNSPLDGNEKPDGLTAEELRQWCQHFGVEDEDDQPGY